MWYGCIVVRGGSLVYNISINKDFFVFHVFCLLRILVFLITKIITSLERNWRSRGIYFKFICVSKGKFIERELTTFDVKGHLCLKLKFLFLVLPSYSSSFTSSFISSFLSKYFASEPLLFPSTPFLDGIRTQHPPLVPVRILPDSFAHSHDYTIISGDYPDSKILGVPPFLTLYG